MVEAPQEVSARLMAMAQERSSELAVPRRGDSARTRTGKAVEPRMEDVGGRQGESNGRRDPNAGRPRPSRRRRSGYGAANRKEKLRSEGGGRA
jgi:hypothetical protein